MIIFKYIDYRAFLTNYIANRPRKGRGESHRMATFAMIHPSLLSQILSGDKNLSLEQAQLISEYIGLSKIETDYFMTMVLYQRAGSKKLKEYYKEKLDALKISASEVSENVKQDKILTDEEKAVFYSHWLFAAVWLETSIGNGRNLNEICENLNIPATRARSILDFLTANQLCTLKDGNYQMGSQSIHLDKTSPHLARHHANWRLKAINAFDNLSSDELMYTAPLSLSDEDFKKLKDRLIQTIKEVTNTAIESPAEKVVCFNLDFFILKS
ncbi:MAG: TIGR02147 family protein [Pseudobdellovibrionaceae bacterium]